MTRLLAAAGIDPEQWRALTKIYLQMDFRRAGGATKAGAAHRDGSVLPLAGLLIGAFMNSVMIALLVFFIRDGLTAAVLMVTMAGMTISMLLLVDFTGSVVSAEDYWVIAPRPVSSRTYFAARLAAVLTYVLGLALLMSIIPAVVFLGWHQLGFGAFIGAIAATVCSSVAATALIVGAYTWLMAHTSPSRLMRLLSWVHVSATFLSMSGFLLVSRGFAQAGLRDLSLGSIGWVWYVPMTWFGAIVPVLAGTGGLREGVAAAGAVALTFVLLWLAAGRISLEFAAQLSEAVKTPAARPPLIQRIPGFREGEAYAVATLVRAQFRHDLRFRLGVLGVIPMTLFYLFLGWNDGALTDPFAAGARGASPVFMALAFLPMLLQGALQSSDQWRASWIYWATPADPARLIVASKNFVAVFFLGGYLLMLAALWAFFYERAWHALVHAAFVGAGAHMLLQAAMILNPALPFAREPKRAEQSARLFFLFFFGMLFTSLAPALLPWFYRRATWAVALALLVIAATAILERSLVRRARAYAAALELQ